MSCHRAEALSVKGHKSWWVSFGNLQINTLCEDTRTCYVKLYLLTRRPAMGEYWQQRCMSTDEPSVHLASNTYSTLESLCPRKNTNLNIQLRSSRALDVLHVRCQSFLNSAAWTTVFVDNLCTPSSVPV